MSAAIGPNTEESHRGPVAGGVINRGVNCTDMVEPFIKHKILCSSYEALSLPFYLFATLEINVVQYINHEPKPDPSIWQGAGVLDVWPYGGFHLLSL